MSENEKITVNDRATGDYGKQYSQVLKIQRLANSVEHDQKITCCGPHPDDPEKEGHKECGKRIDLMFAYKCLYCGFWFCVKCAEIHFGKTRNEHIREMQKQGKMLHVKVE